jgi:PPP family 3-phenylpropionic acid transporter
MSKLTLRRNVGYAGLSGAYWMLYCVAVSYASVFLQSRGYSTGQIGAIVAAGHIVSLVLQPLAASLADRSPTAPVAVIIGCALCGAACLTALVLLPEKGPGLTAAFVLLLTFVMTLQPLVNAFSFYLERLNTSIYFGACRGIGSLAYAVVSAVLGTLTLRTGMTAVPVTGILICLGMAALMLLLRREGTPPPVNREAAQAGHATGPRDYIRRYRSFLILLGATVFLFFSHASVMNFTMQVVENVGGTSQDVGRLYSYTALVELPAMVLFDKLHRRFTCTGLLKFAGVFFLVKSTLVFLAHSVGGLYFALFFQSLSFPLFATASVRYAGEQLAAADQNKAQANLTAMITLGNILGSGVGGLVYDSLGMHLGLAVGACAAGAGMLLLFGMAREKSRSIPYIRRT